MWLRWGSPIYCYLIRVGGTCPPSKPISSAPEPRNPSRNGPAPIQPRPRPSASSRPASPVCSFTRRHRRKPCPTRMSRPLPWPERHFPSHVHLLSSSHSDVRLGLQYNVANYWYKANFASDLLHHISHILVLTEGVVKHNGDPWGALWDWRRMRMEASLRGTRIHSNGFALEGYAYEVGNPGTGCAGARAAHTTSTSAASLVLALPPLQ